MGLLVVCGGVLRIVSGEFRGRILDSAPGSDIRPTTDRVRGAIFSALGSQRNIEGSAVLDLFAGTGALGLEALSRGAAAAVFVERSDRHAAAIRANISKLGVEARSKVLVADAASNLPTALLALQVLLPEAKGFSVVFADPPYSEHPGASLLMGVLRSRVVLDGSILVVEGPITLEIPERLGAECTLSALQTKTKTYGDTRVFYYSVTSEPQDSTV